MHSKLEDQALIFGREVEVIFFRVPSMGPFLPQYSSRQCSSLGNLQTTEVSSHSKPILHSKGSQKLQSLPKSYETFCFSLDTH